MGGVNWGRSGELDVLGAIVEGEAKAGGEERDGGDGFVLWNLRRSRYRARGGLGSCSRDLKTQSAKVEVDGLVEEDVAASLTRRVAKELLDIALLDRVDRVVVENDPTSAALDDRNIVAMMRSPAAFPSVSIHSRKATKEGKLTLQYAPQSPRARIADLDC